MIRYLHTFLVTSINVTMILIGKILTLVTSQLRSTVYSIVVDSAKNA